MTDQRWWTVEAVMVTRKRFYAWGDRDTIGSKIQGAAEGITYWDQPTFSFIVHDDDAPAVADGNLVWDGECFIVAGQRRVVDAEDNLKDAIDSLKAYLRREQQ